MALNNIAKFNWEKIVSKVDNPEILRSLNMLRAKSNEILSTSSKLQQDNNEKIDFDSYKKKLKFTSAAVGNLENVYKNKKLPTYSAALPSFQANKRNSVLAVVRNIVEAAKDDSALLNHQLEEFEKTKISKDTTYGEYRQRFPAFANEIEAEIKNHEWTK
jgi:heme oxygenase